MVFKTDNRVTSEPGLFGVAVDEMQLSHYCGVPMIRNTFVIKNSAGTAQWEVNPTDVHISGGTDSHPTFLAFATLPCIWYRGSIRYMLFFVCSGLMSARIRVRYVPALTSEDSGFDFDQLSQVYDINGPTTIQFDVAYTWHRPWHLVGSKYGTFHIELYNEITSLDIIGDPPIQLILYVAGGGDFEMSMPFGEHYQDLAETKVLAETNPRKIFGESFEMFHDSMLQIKEGNITMGEKITSIGDYLRIAKEALDISYTGIFSAGARKVTRINGWPTRGGHDPSIFDHFKRTFLGFRGSFNYEILPTDVMSSRVAASIELLNIGTSIPDENTPIKKKQQPIHLMEPSYISRLAVNIPFISSRLWRLTNEANYDTTDLRPILAVSQQVMNIASNTYHAGVNIYRSIGDDFMFLHMAGAVPVKTGSNFGDVTNGSRYVVAVQPNG
jgi:hypothetical protein